MQPAMPPSLPRCCCFLPSSHCHLHWVAKETPVPQCSLLKSTPRIPTVHCCGCDCSLCDPSRLQPVQIAPAAFWLQPNLRMESLSLQALHLFLI